MRIKSILAAAAIALAATIGSASAADQFTTLKGIEAHAMTPQEMGAILAKAVLIVGADDKAGGRCVCTALPVDNGGNFHIDNADSGLDTASNSGGLNGGASGIITFTDLP